jgi:hypothetical protein
MGTHAAFTSLRRRGPMEGRRTGSAVDSWSNELLGPLIADQY